MIEKNQKSISLSVVIPTRNRCISLNKTIQHFINAYFKSESFRPIEICVVDNFSEDNTETVVREYQKIYPFIKYARQNTPYESPEGALGGAIKKANGNLVWIFGDDDEPLLNCFSNLSNHLDEATDFYLLNSVIRAPSGQQVSNFGSNEKSKFYIRAVNLWLDYGFTSATAAFSSLLFRKRYFSENLIGDFRKVSELYAHSVSLCAMFYNCTAKLVAEPMYIYNAVTAQEEEIKLKKYYWDKKVPADYSFSAGLLLMLLKAAKICGIKSSRLLCSREVQISKSTWERVDTKTISFITSNSQSYKKKLKLTKLIIFNRHHWALFLTYYFCKHFKH